MKSIKSYFTLSAGTSVEDVFSECINWILDSPYTSFAQEELNKYSSEDEFSHVGEGGGEVIDYSYASADGLAVSSMRYSKSQDALKWVTEVSTRSETGILWVSVVASIVTTTALTASEGIEIKRPLISIRLLDRFGGGADGDFPLSISPIMLEDDSTGREIARRVIVGENVSALPVIYVSASAFGRHALIPDRFARKICGMAHVVIEPSRDFSFKLRPLVNSRNVYAGAVGIYWPNGAEVTLCRRGTDDAKSFENRIFKCVAEALSVLIPPQKCGWDEVAHVKNRNAIEALKENGEANEIIGLYEVEISEKDATIAQMQKEIDRLSYMLRVSESKRPVQGGLILDTGAEDDYFELETLSVVLSAVKEYSSKSTHPNSRRQHLMEAILDSNESNDLHEQKARMLKDALRGYREMSKKVRDTFEELGFTVESDARHWRVVYQDDERYTYVLPKTGSDHRGGLNAGADISNLVF
ncbi:hypothetical protein AS889_13150 [Pseudomonas putida]|uniref:hypothetical protein n=1 Tax=Pseudomonas putida TaxID=303 RepID=UPI0007716E33|nr:hypothetical protein [Pseudomonas putida]KWW14956.1 hypothetical protein AS889_13150 [Pseudomonas putida]